MARVWGRLVPFGTAFAADVGSAGSSEQIPGFGGLLGPLEQSLGPVLCPSSDRYGVSELISDFGVNVWVEIVAQLYVQLYESYLPRASHDVTYYD